MDRYDDDLPEPENFSHALDEGEVVQLCAGMPQTGTRELSPEEKADLSADRVYLLQMGLARFATALFCLVLSGCAFGYLHFSTDRPFWLTVLTGVVATAALLCGLVALFRTVELLLRRWVLSRAVEAGYVRVFEGTVNPEDYTDKSLEWLAPTDLLYPDPDDPNRIELYPKHNVVYSINYCEPDGWYAVVLTCAAAVPGNPLVLDVPAEWSPGLPDLDLGILQRRRQTQTEQSEILNYAREGQRRLYIVPALFGVAVFLAVVILLARLVQLDLVVSAAVAGGIGALVAVHRGMLFWKRFRDLTADAEFGWIMIFTPDDSQDQSDSDDEFWQDAVAMEFLPVSETVWSLAGRPAGWRYAAQLQPPS